MQRADLSGRAARKFLFFAALLLSVADVYAAEVEVHGFLLGTASSRVSQVPLATGEKNNWLLAEERLRINLSVESDEGNSAMVGKIDFLNDQVAGNVDIDVRELYGEYIADDFEVRVGRQILTWGVTDRLFINDVFPKDWSAFFAGKPLEYMKLGSDMAKIFLFGDRWDLELALIPVARFDIMPGSDRFVLYDPGFNTVEPDKTLFNGEIAARFHTTFGTTDVALYLFKGFWHQPDRGVAPNGTSFDIIYPRLNNYGFTIQDTVFGGVLSLEGGFYQSVDDKSGTDPLIANSQYRYMVGYEREIATDMTLALQWYGEVMKSYADYLTSAAAAFQANQGPKPLPEHRKFVTVNLRALWMNQTVTTSMFFMGISNGGGRLLNPDVNYAVTDSFSVNAGSNIFWGGYDSGMLGMMKNSDNIYMNIKWMF